MATLASVGIGLGLVAIALFVYTTTHPFRYYDHFEWQAQAFLEGQAAIRYPVAADAESPGNAFFQDVLPVETADGLPRGLIPFPPLPAVVLLPFVAAWGRAADGQLIFAIIGAIDVGLAWWVLGRLPIRRSARLTATIFFGFGTVFWYAAQIGTTWYQAHVLAVGLALLAIGLAIGADRDAVQDEDDLPEDAGVVGAGVAGGSGSGSGLAMTLAPLLAVDRRQFIAGFLFGLACTARLTMIFAAPFFVLVGGGGTWQRRGWSAALGAAIPLAALVAYNIISTGHLFNPAYDYLYHLEAGFYTALNYNPAWGIEDPRYLPQNIAIMLYSTPAIAPDVVPSTLGGGAVLCTEPGAVRSLFDAACPIALPRDIGMSVILTSPAYLLLGATFRRYGRSRLVSGAFLAILVIALVNLMHFSQGWVQFGYRFSLDFVPWALVLVALGLDRLRSTAAVVAGGLLVAASVAVNLWGVVMGNALGVVSERTSTIVRSGAVVGPLIVVAVAVALGVWRLMPGVGVWDTAEFQTVPPLLGTAHPTGYPTYVIIGWLASAVLAPFGEAALRMNLLSAILVGLAAGLTVDLVRRLVGSTVVAVATGLGLAATPIVWSIATHADPHALHLLFVVAIAWLLVRWETARADRPDRPDRADRWLLAGAAVTGLSAGNHSLTLLLCLPIALYVLAVEPEILRRRRFVALCIAVFAAAALAVYLELPIRGGLIPALRAPLVYGSPDTLGGFVYVATGEQFRGGLNDPFGELPRKVADLVGLTVGQFGLLSPLLIVGFAATVARFPAYALLSGSAVAITCFFDSAYVNADIERYYLGPAMFAWTWLAFLAAAGIDTVRTTLWPPRHGARRLDGPVVAALAAVILLTPTVSALPQRAAIVDRTTDRAAEAWLDDVLSSVEQNAVILSCWSFSTPLWYAQLVEGRRPDIAIIDDRTRLDEHLGDLTDVIDATIATRPVYVLRFAEADLDPLRLRYDLTPLDSLLAGNVYHVTARPSADRP